MPKKKKSHVIGTLQPYERPENPELVVRTTKDDGGGGTTAEDDDGSSCCVPVLDCVQRVLDVLAASDIVSHSVAAGAPAW